MSRNQAAQTEALIATLQQQVAAQADAIETLSQQVAQQPAPVVQLPQADLNALVAAAVAAAQAQAPANIAPVIHETSGKLDTKKVAEDGSINLDPTNGKPLRMNLVEVLQKLK